MISREQYSVCIMILIAKINRTHPIRTAMMLLRLMLSEPPEDFFLNNSGDRKDKKEHKAEINKEVIIGFSEVIALLK